MQIFSLVQVPPHRSRAEQVDGTKKGEQEGKSGAQQRSVVEMAEAKKEEKAFYIGKSEQ